MNIARQELWKTAELSAASIPTQRKARCVGQPVSSTRTVWAQMEISVQVNEHCAARELWKIAELSAASIPTQRKARCVGHPVSRKQPRVVWGSQFQENRQPVSRKQ